jgi:hypothetical protein
MARNAGFAIISVILLLGILAAIGASGRERAKRAVCLANLRQLTAAWSLYADQNDGKIVNGVAGFHYLKSGDPTLDGSDPNIVERAWVGKGWRDNFASPSMTYVGPPEAQKMRYIHEGALWPLIGRERCYKCPLGRAHEWVTYSIVDAMNGMYRAGTISSGSNHLNGVGTRIGDTVLWIKNRAEIISPPPSERMVFIDEGAMTPDTFGVNYSGRTWWDNPPARHDYGATVSWADGHSIYLWWKGAETIEFGREHRDYYGGGFTPQTPDGIKDLQDFQRAVWGRLGYDPSK